MARTPSSRGTRNLLLVGLILFTGLALAAGYLIAKTVVGQAEDCYEIFAPDY